ncbi:hypothetical protein GYH30_019100 [Glycine max]|nr:hypothetical protein GYH30_019100 [Glycine max]
MVVIDDSNPLILHSSDNPDIALVSHPLTGENYHSWKKAMCMALHGKNKYGFVDGSIPEPALERFKQRNGPLIFKLKHELIILQQGSMFVSSFYSKLRSLWESPSELKPSHSCTCGGIKPWCNFEQLEYAMQFLMGLNESFSTIKGQILSMDPFPPITKVFALIVQEEKQKEVGASTYGTFANMLGHTQDRCFKLHGYPPNYKKNGYSSEVKKQSSSSFEPSYKVVHQVSVDMPQSQPSSVDLGLQFQLTVQQYCQLMNLLQSHATNVVFLLPLLIFFMIVGF